MLAEQIVAIAAYPQYTSNSLFAAPLSCSYNRMYTQKKSQRDANKQKPLIDKDGTRHQFCAHSFSHLLSPRIAQVRRV